MNQGYIKVWRKLLDDGSIKNHKRFCFWMWCLMRASHKEHDAFVGHQIVHLLPGQFIFGLHVASTSMNLTISEVRSIIGALKRRGSLTIKSTNKFSVITVLNWSPYQIDDDENDKQINRQIANKSQHTRRERMERNNISPEKIRSNIAGLIMRYPDQETISQAFAAIQSTRKTNRMADSVRHAILLSWEKHPVDAVMAGIRTYLAKGCAYQGKDEKYLLGIIRNATTDLTKTPPPAPPPLPPYSPGIVAPRIITPASLAPGSQTMAAPAPATSTMDAQNCPACGTRIVVMADLTADGCVYCMTRPRATRPPEPETPDLRAPDMRALTMRASNIKAPDLRGPDLQTIAMSAAEANA